ncbi:TetR/AcrR family transcriptional regulator [Robertmurraya andreesenii]|uniref:AcrR family transcriptional regulator n=1 Tax=Anoxybacillus andreesenii TaxID=1325932 RepID=A0ABT9VA05_9BACL|nr:TetR/AcrR family transcriptional regulator [Robertmurraya andreesenii]MDQ0157745.1 AcrR family transcriptional regulator [Robertmurraya andreesenii]
MAPIVSKDYKERRKSSILSSALECFAQKGFVATTVDDIGAHSGISKGSIYNYFESKEAIYFELLNTATERDKENITKNFSTLRSSLSKLSYMFDVFLTLDPFNPKRLGTTVVFYEFTFHCTRSEKLLDLVTKRGNFLLNIIKETLEEGQESGEIDKNIDVNLYAHRFWLIIDGVSLQTIHKDFPYYDVLREMKEMYLEEIKAK